MKVTPAVAAIPAVMVLLTWLSCRAVDLEAEQYDRTLKALDHFTAMETALHRDVLRARTGMLRNYDPLVREVNVLRASLGRLRSSHSADAKEAEAIDRFAAAVTQQEELTEQFKSNNALLQNSLAHFRFFSARLSASDESGPLVPAVSALAAAMLQLTLDTSPAAAREVADRLNGLATQAVPPSDADSVAALLAHGRLIHDLLPTTDAVLRALLEAPNQQELKALRTMVLTGQASSRATAREFRLLLYAVSLVLVGLLIHFGLQLRGRALTLHRRAAFEHLIAGISTHLIEAQRHEIGAHVERALAELADHIGADRAYLVVSGNMSRIHTWSRRGVAFPPDWPDRVPAVAARFGVIPDGVHIRSVARLAPGPDKDALAAVGLYGWACVSKLGKCGGFNAFLGFDALRPGIVTEAAELGLLRMALDAIANAVGRGQLEQERLRLEANLQQARRMETIGALTSGIAHNFNNIVGAILGYTEMVEAQFGPGARFAGNLNEIRLAGERARDLVDQILAFGRRSDAQRRPVSMKELLDETRSLLHASLPSWIELAIREVPDVAVVFGEPGQLQQVILNLCNNAAHAMDQTGSIEIETQVREIKTEQSFCHGKVGPGRYVRIAVSDSGRGIDETTLDYIFEPFFTTRLAGNGLGLATVREIVREHDGAIDVWSVPGKGSRFEVWLPGIAVTQALSRDEVSSLSLGRGETVLVVEDSRERLLADEELLAALGYEPVGFTRADDALAACRATPKRFDAVLVGHLASAASLDLAVMLHELMPYVPILLATASADERGPDALVAAGISEVVHRPLVSTELASALGRCLTMSKLSSAHYDRNAFLQY